MTLFLVQSGLIYHHNRGMQPIEFKEFVPRGDSFYLRKTDKRYTLNPMTLLDEDWIRENIGEEINVLFQKMNMRDLCRVAFHQMCEEDKEDFLAREATFIDDKGEKIKRKIGGAELLCHFISGPHEKKDLTEALYQTAGFSRAMIEKWIKDQAEKKQPENKKKEPHHDDPSIGQKSLTSSQASTDGQLSTSSPGQDEKSCSESSASESA